MNKPRATTPPTTNPDLLPGRLCAVVLKLPPCGDDPRVQCKLLYGNARGVCVQYVGGHRRVTWYGPTRFYSWADLAGLHIATQEASERFFTRAKRKNAHRNTAA